MDVVRAFAGAFVLALVVGGFAYLSALALGAPLWGLLVGGVAFVIVFIQSLDR